MDTSKLIYGLRRNNRSLKIYRTTNEKFLGVEKFYFLGFCFKRKKYDFPNYADAEDKIVYFKNDTRM